MREAFRKTGSEDTGDKGRLDGDEDEAEKRMGLGR